LEDERGHSYVVGTFARLEVAMVRAVAQLALRLVEGHERCNRAHYRTRFSCGVVHDLEETKR
jgi:hypothetical protein